jgi:hypothetical protein
VTRNARVLGAIVGGVIAASALFAMTAGAATSGKSESGTIYTAITHTAGGYEYAAGNSTSNLFGTDAVTYKIKAGASKNGITLAIPSIVTYTSTGELSGHGTAKLEISGTTETVTDGKFELTTGTGALKGHSESGTFKGVGNTKTGQYVFTQKGTYK